jgi:glycosyl hydrolase, family 18
MQIHVVKDGDTLFEIANMHGVSVDQLIAANGESVEPSLVIGQAVVIPGNERRGSLKVNGYAYPNINRAVLNATLPYLTYFTIFSYGVSPEGGIVSIEDMDLIGTARDGGVAPVMLLTTIDQQGKFSSQNAVAILSDPQKQDILIDNIMVEINAKGYMGLDVDFEYIPPEQRENYAKFLRKLKAQLSELGLPLFVALAPKTSADQPGLLYEAHDYRLLGSIADYSLIMTYEWGYTYGPPMAVAPLDKVAEVMRFAVTQIPPEKLFMGIPNYGYDWTLPYQRGTAADSISNTEAISIARRYGAQIQFDPVSASPYFNYYDQSGKEHVVWFEDARSIQAKLMLVRDLKLTGIAFWNVMSFFQPALTVLDSMFNIEKVL